MGYSVVETYFDGRYGEKLGDKCWDLSWDWSYIFCGFKGICGIWGCFTIV